MFDFVPQHGWIGLDELPHVEIMRRRILCPNVGTDWILKGGGRWVHVVKLIIERFVIEETKGCVEGYVYYESYQLNPDEKRNKDDSIVDFLRRHVYVPFDTGNGQYQEDSDLRKTFDSVIARFN